MVSLTSAVSIEAGIQRRDLSLEGDTGEPAPACRPIDTDWFSGWVNDIDGMFYYEKEGCDRALSNLGNRD